MLFSSFLYKGDKYIGYIKGDLIYPIKNNINGFFNSMLDFIENSTKEKINQLSKENRADGINIKDVKILSPIPLPKRNIICVGKNYKEHIDEIAGAIGKEHEVPNYPVFFTKMVNKTLGPFENIKSHSDVTKSLDYEAELAIIIGKDGTNIKKENVKKHIFGYTILNDISARDIQRQHIQWFRGKSLDDTCPVGPYILHIDSISYPPKLDIKCIVNGEVRQNSNTDKFIFDIDTVVSEFSKGITLKRGDIISTGTPSGVAMGMENKPYLKRGDKVECYIENIGSLINTVE